MVDRLMAVLRRGDVTSGYLRLNLVGHRLDGYIRLDNVAFSDNARLLYRVNDGKVTDIRLSDIIDAGFREDTQIDTLDSLECIVIDDENIIAKGISQGSIDDINMTAFSEVSPQNRHTYNEVKDNVDVNNVEDNEGLVEQSQGDDEIEAESPIKADSTASIIDENTIDCLYNDGSPFYDAISSQLEELFSRYEREHVLEDAVPNSRFSRIFYDDDSYYVVGEIKDDKGTPEVVCYGYPGEGGKTPPEGVLTSYEWLPLDKNDVTGKGYYMMYQNAVTGDILAN